MFEETFRIDDRAQYFKDLSLERSARDDINLVYNGRPIATFSPKHNTITQIRGKTLADFKNAVKIYHNFLTTQELGPQVVEILDPQPEEEYDLDPLLQDIEDKRVEFEKERESKKDRVVKDILYPEKKDEVPPKKKEEEISIAREFFSGFRDFTRGAVSITSSIVGGTAKGVAGLAKAVTNTNGNPVDTAVNISQVRTDIETNMDYVSLKRDLEVTKTLLEEKKLQTKTYKKDIEEKDEKIRKLNMLLRNTTDTNIDERVELKSEIEKLQKQRDSMTRKFQIEQSKGFEKDSKIEDLKADLSFTGKQLIDKDREIDSTKQELKKLQDYVDTYKDSSSKVSNQLAETKNKLKKLQTEYDQLLSNYKGKEKEIEDFKKSIPDKVSKALDSVKKVTEKDRKTIRDF